MIPAIDVRSEIKTILLVEDHASLRELSQTILSSRGFAELEAEDGAQALSLAQSARTLDLVITDLGMPGMNGMELADRLNAITPVKVLFLSGDLNAVISAQQRFGGRADFLSKPFTAAKLLDRVNALLNG